MIAAGQAQHLQFRAAAGQGGWVHGFLLLREKDASHIPDRRRPARSTARMECLTERDGAGGRARTGKALRPRDFKSLAYTNFATPAWPVPGIIGFAGEGYTGCKLCRKCGLTDPLEDGGQPLPAANAHGFQAIACLTALHLPEHRGQDPHAGCADWMAERDAGAIHVQPLHVIA